MPVAAIAPLIGLGGSLISGLAKSGKQGSVDTKTTKDSEFSQSQEQFQNQTGSNRYNNRQDIEEAGYFGDFRQGITRGINQGLHDAKTPVYGQAETAGFLNNLNDLANASMTSLKGKLGAGGKLDSGDWRQQVSDVEMGRLSEASKFMSQIPMLNRQYSDQQTNALLGMGAGFAGRAPWNTVQTGDSSSDQTMTGYSSASGKSRETGNQTQSQTGPSWWKSMLNDAGGWMGDQMGQPGHGDLSGFINWLPRLFNRGGGGLNV